jgi:hypothetical protein
MVRLTAVREAAREIANCGVGIVMGCPRNRFAGARGRECDPWACPRGNTFSPSSSPGAAGGGNPAQGWFLAISDNPQTILTAYPSRPNVIRQLPLASTVSWLVLWPKCLTRA